jgi:hypothetical protein
VAVVALLLWSGLFGFANQPLRTSPASRDFISFVAYADNATATNSTGTTNSTSQNFTQPAFSNELTFDREYYVPTTITLDFPVTTNTNLGNVSTIGDGQYNYEGADDSFTFLAKSVDVYTFTFTINYPNVSLNSILIAAWEGDRPMQGETWTAIAASYTIYFTLSLVNEPEPPTASQTAQAAMLQFEQLFQQLLQANQQTAQSTQNMVFGASVLVMVALGVAIVALIFARRAYTERKKRLETT